MSYSSAAQDDAPALDRGEGLSSFLIGELEDLGLISAPVLFLNCSTSWRACGFQLKFTRLIWPE
jgi:hypothetical protein